MLDAVQCAKLRAAVDASAMAEMDSVDGLLEHQLTLEYAELEALIGEESVEQLCELALQSHIAVPASSAAEQSAREAGVQRLVPCLAGAPHEIFIRRFCEATRPWFGFHHDRAFVTINVALTSDSDHGGGKLLAVLDGRVQRCARLEGTATLHASTLLHAVTRMTAGVRYSLILFYGPLCPDPCHKLVLCNAQTMALIYPIADGSYSCDKCGYSAEELGYPPMWHCSQGCEYDICNACHHLGV